MRSLAGTILVLLAIVLWNAYREHGSYGVRSWLSAKFLNRPLEPPRKTVVDAKALGLTGRRPRAGVRKAGKSIGQAATP